MREIESCARGEDQAKRHMFRPGQHRENALKVSEAGWGTGANDTSFCGGTGVEPAEKSFDHAPEKGGGEAPPWGPGEAQVKLSRSPSPRKAPTPTRRRPTSARGSELSPAFWVFFWGPAALRLDAAALCHLQRPHRPGPSAAGCRFRGPQACPHPAFSHTLGHTPLQGAFWQCFHCVSTVVPSVFPVSPHLLSATLPPVHSFCSSDMYGGPKCRKGH